MWDTTYVLYVQRLPLESIRTRVTVTNSEDESRIHRTGLYCGPSQLSSRWPMRNATDEKSSAYGSLYSWLSHLRIMLRASGAGCSPRKEVEKLRRDKAQFNGNVSDSETFYAKRLVSIFWNRVGNLITHTAFDFLTPQVLIVLQRQPGWSINESSRQASRHSSSVLPHPTALVV